MHNIKIIVLTIAVSISGCQERIPPPDVASILGNKVSAPREELVLDKQNNSDASTVVALSKKCGDSEAILGCGNEHAIKDTLVDCIKTSLRIKIKTGQISEIDNPGEIADYSAVGLGCAVSSQNKNSYFIVQYGEIPRGCAFCEWFYLYDLGGKQLTKNDPIILVDESLPVGNIGART